MSYTANVGFSAKIESGLFTLAKMQLYSAPARLAAGHAVGEGGRARLARGYRGNERNGRRVRIAVPTALIAFSIVGRVADRPYRHALGGDVL